MRHGLPEDFAREIRVDGPLKTPRLDAYLGGVLVDVLSRSKIKKLILGGSIVVDGRAVSPHYHLKEGETIRVDWKDDSDDSTQAEAIPLVILYEDDDLIAVDKPAGMVVHPACGNQSHTLVNALLYHVQSLRQCEDRIRPGIVHRLDKDTSGILIVAKNDRAHEKLARQFKQHTIRKVYYAAVKGVVQRDEGLCEEPVGRAFLNRKKVVIKPSGGRDAATYFRVLKRFNRTSLVEVRPRTGRTHQIRVHMAHIGHPVLGDELYGVRSPWICRQALHAFSLTFAHPADGREIHVEAPLPEDMKQLIARLEAER
ncbi:MAG: RluA family pseudouridine synthase [Candidatus Omnitrophota bacterium]|jgi:23S rRNA pseudouridine1911/1915/1917 synthase